MSTLSFESLCLKDDDCPSPTLYQGSEDEFDTDLESDGKYIKSFLDSFLPVSG